MVIFVGIDYSISCPSMCVHTGTDWSYNNCKFFYLINKKKSLVCNDKFTSELHKKFESPEERYDQISEFFLEQLKKFESVKLVTIEGYSFGSVGQVFSIAECAGIIKHKLFKDKYSIMTVAPTTVKKFASGKGNASKLQMSAAFQQETSVDMSKVVNCQLADSPANDIVDSYFMCKYGFFNNNNKINSL